MDVILIGFIAWFLLCAFKADRQHKDKAAEAVATMAARAEKLLDMQELKLRREADKQAALASRGAVSSDAVSTASVMPTQALPPPLPNSLPPPLLVEATAPAVRDRSIKAMEARIEQAWIAPAPKRKRKTAAERRAEKIAAEAAQADAAAEAAQAADVAQEMAALEQHLRDHDGLDPDQVQPG